MYYPQKLKPDRSITGLIPAIACILTCLLAFIGFGIRGLYFATACFFGGYSVISLLFYLRTRNSGYLAASVWQILFGLYIGSRLYSEIFGANNRLTMLVVLFLIPSTIWLLYLFFNRKAKWRGRELFELASMETPVTPDGFTSRPRPAGRAEYSMEDLEGFTEFLRRNLIAVSYREENRIVFMLLKGGDEFGYLFSPGKFRTGRTWVAFDFNGNITVNISQRDYLDYKDEFSFDQLCEKMGRLFADFMGYYRKNETDRIIYLLDELKLSLTS